MNDIDADIREAVKHLPEREQIETIIYAVTVAFTRHRINLREFMERTARLEAEHRLALAKLN